MKIVHVSTYDIEGGAARAAYRLHDGLRRGGQQSSMFVNNKSSNDNTVVKYKRPMGLFGVAARVYRRHSIQKDHAEFQLAESHVELFSDERSAYGATVMKQLPPAEIYNLHWIAGFVDYAAYFETVKIPTVWTFHDMNAFTGGCHYDCGCARYVGQCGNCPQLDSHDPKDVSHEIWTRKKGIFAALAARRLHIVTPSQWLKRETARSSIFGTTQIPVSVIPYGIDTKTYAPQDRAKSRAELGIPLDASVVLFVSDSLENRRKGFQYLLQALKELRGTPNLFLLSLGRGTTSVDPEIQQVHLGFISDEAKLAKIYGAADVYAIPSLQDNLPNTVLESLACGTPVAGFASGGIPDMVRDGQTGRCVPPQDAPALARAISEIISQQELRRKLGENARQVAHREYRLDLQTRAYLKLYHSMIENFQTRAMPRPT